MNSPPKITCQACGFTTSQPCITITQASQCPAFKTQNNKK